MHYHRTMQTMNPTVTELFSAHRGLGGTMKKYRELKDGERIEAGDEYRTGTRPGDDYSDSRFDCDPEKVFYRPIFESPTKPSNVGDAADYIAHLEAQIAKTK